jgi:putative hydrolase of the HAD superfamily
LTEDLKFALFDLDQTLCDRLTATRVLAGQLFDSDALNTNRINRDLAIDEFLRLDKNGYEPDKLKLFTNLEKSWDGLKRSPSELAEWLKHTPRTWYTPDDRIVSFLTDLNDRGVTWGIVTNGPQTQNDKALRLGILNGASCFIVSDVIGVAKPEPEIFNIALQEIGSPDPQNVLFVGDNPLADIAGAKSVGMTTAWIHHNNQWPVDITPPDYTLDSVIDCAQLFEYSK